MRRLRCAREGAYRAITLLYRVVFNTAGRRDEAYYLPIGAVLVLLTASRVLTSHIKWFSKSRETANLTWRHAITAVIAGVLIVTVQLLLFGWIDGAQPNGLNLTFVTSLLKQASTSRQPCRRVAILASRDFNGVFSGFTGLLRLKTAISLSHFSLHCCELHGRNNGDSFNYFQPDQMYVSADDIIRIRFDGTVDDRIVIRIIFDNLVDLLRYQY